ncbi:PASTA domain-containing penicillin-binding protein [Caldalkalibacillus salinus]|uniref:PASTA domain-containing penicillin-binding protein n=1 Tax=Caldalkalibacillus salinus TaxID=2803787 RepID=UPI001923006A|nr:PASTA domain-containing penicillin-binding protein [Caldalkalibacillus salinus]
MDKQKRKMNKRGQLMGAIFLLLFFSMIYRFYVLQVVEASYLQEQGEKMYSRENVLPAERGTIYDRNGKMLAHEAKAYTVIAVLSDKAPEYITDPQEAAQALAPLLGMSEERLASLMTREGNEYQVELRPGGWKVNRETMEEINDLDIPGIIFREENKRAYPNHNFASHVIGFINREGESVMGLEAHLNDELKGQDGTIEFKQDRNGKRLPDGISSIIEPVNGDDVYLTIDDRIQHYVEQALDQAEEQYEPEGMTVVVSRPKTGEILAMSSRPSFDPNHYSSITNYVNHAISSTYEPGSTFKIVTLAAAIEEGVFNPKEKYMSGSYSLPGGRIRDHNGRGWGEITFLEGVQKSSNVAFSILGSERIKKETFYDYIYRFGFGERTGIDLPNESRGIVNDPKGLPPLTLANMTFGQGVAVTAIQQVAAINAIANGGTLYQPYIIDSIVNSESNEVIMQNEPIMREESVVSTETAREVIDILETVVTEGTGQNFYIDGYNVAGKTGTAQKPSPDGGYYQNKYVHSFIGLAPKDDPELVVYVAVDAPDVTHYSVGGSVVAQIFKHIMRSSLQYLSVLPEVGEEEENIQPHEVDKVTVQDYKGVSIMTARQKAEDEGLEVVTVGEGTTVSEQLPAPHTKLPKGSRIYLLTGERQQQTQVPDFTEWSVRSVLDWSNVAQVQVNIVGSGYASDQSLDPGATIRAGDEMTINFEPRYTESEGTDEGETDQPGENDANHTQDEDDVADET